ncbi:hypothetical protein F4804DRAFT_337415 [Jackrogersella minutella]|nr:hypothetical protein F4804DRAFT_337415 [Jackrogersella minutella]
MSRVEESIRRRPRTQNAENTTEQQLEEPSSPISQPVENQLPAEPQNQPTTGRRWHGTEVTPGILARRIRSQLATLHEGDNGENNYEERREATPNPVPEPPGQTVERSVFRLYSMMNIPHVDGEYDRSNDVDSEHSLSSSSDSEDPFIYDRAATSTRSTGSRSLTRSATISDTADNRRHSHEILSTSSIPNINAPGIRPTTRIHGHANGRVNGHVNGQVNDHAHGQTNGYVNGQTNGYTNGHVHSHTNGEANEPVNNQDINQTRRGSVNGLAEILRNEWDEVNLIANATLARTLAINAAAHQNSAEYLNLMADFLAGHVSPENQDLVVGSNSLAASFLRPFPPSNTPSLGTSRRTSEVGHHGLPPLRQFNFNGASHSNRASHQEDLSHRLNLLSNRPPNDDTESVIDGPTATPHRNMVPLRTAPRAPNATPTPRSNASQPSSVDGANDEQPLYAFRSDGRRWYVNLARFDEYQRRLGGTLVPRHSIDIPDPVYDLNFLYPNRPPGGVEADKADTDKPTSPTGPDPQGQGETAGTSQAANLRTRPAPRRLPNSPSSDHSGSSSSSSSSPATRDGIVHTANQDAEHDNEAQNQDIELQPDVPAPDPPPAEEIHRVRLPAGDVPPWSWRPPRYIGDYFGRAWNRMTCRAMGPFHRRVLLAIFLMIVGVIIYTSVVRIDPLGKGGPPH